MRGVAATAAPAKPAATSSLRRLSPRLSCTVMAAPLPGYLQDKLDRRSRTNSSLTGLRSRSLLSRHGLRAKWVREMGSGLDGAVADGGDRPPRRSPERPGLPEAADVS